MTKPDYLTEEQYEFLFRQIDEILNPSFKFHNRTQFGSWLDSVWILDGWDWNINLETLNRIKIDDSIRNELNDYITLLKL